MTTELLITALFRLSTGTTVLACEGPHLTDLNGKAAQILIAGAPRQLINLIGVRQMIGSESKNIAIETSDNVFLSKDEIQSGTCRLLILS